MPDNDPTYDMLLEELNTVKGELATARANLEAMQNQVNKVVDFNRSLLKSKGIDGNSTEVAKDNANKALIDFIKKKGF